MLSGINANAPATCEQIKPLLANWMADCWLPGLWPGLTWRRAHGCMRRRGLSARQMRDGRIHSVGTKSSTDRVVPIDQDMLRQVKKAMPFGETVEAVGLELPVGQLRMCLTFASHYMMKGDILNLRRVSGVFRWRLP